MLTQDQQASTSQAQSLCMEWPEKVEEILPEDVLKVYITTLEDGSRSIEF